MGLLVTLFVWLCAAICAFWAIVYIIKGVEQLIKHYKNKWKKQD